MEFDGVAPWVAAEQGGCTAVGAQQAEQDADRDGLAGAVRAEETVDFAGANVEVEPVECVGGTERLVQSFDRDR